MIEKGSFCIALVACVKQKSSQPSLAKDLYTSTWFRKARAYVEQQGWDWYILSAQHGLLAPDALIQPYEQTFNKMPAGDRHKWASQVIEQISEMGCDRNTIFHIFAGQKYREYLLPELQNSGYIVKIPLAHLGIGQQLAWFKSQLADISS